MSSSSPMYVVIVGCGRLGRYLAERFSRSRHRVMVIDSNAEAFGRLAASYSGFRLEGDASELAVLLEAKLGDADLAIVATSEQNTNLLVAQIAKKLMGVPRVVARVSEPERAAVYRELGIDTLCAVSMLGDEILAEFLPPVGDD